MSIFSSALDAVFGTSSGPKLGQVVEGSGYNNLMQGVKSASAAVGFGYVATIPAVISGVGASLAATGSSVAKTVTSAVAKNPLISAGVGLVGYGAVKNDPIGTGKAVLSGTNKLGAGLINVGSNSQQFIANPSLDTGKKILTDNPLIVGGTALVLAGGAVSAGNNFYNSYLTKKSNSLTEQSLNLTGGGSSPAPVNLISDASNKFDAKITDSTNDTLLAIEKEKTKQAEFMSKSSPLVSSPANSLPAATPIAAAKKATKKKTTKKKAPKKKKSKKTTKKPVKKPKKKVLSKKKPKKKAKK
jgi:hypothetical protein